MNEVKVHENLIKITKYERSGMLPDPFLFDDGIRRVETVADWEERRKEIYKSAVELQFGTIAPEPEFLEVEPLYIAAKGKPSTYRIITGTRKSPVVFGMTLFRAKSKYAPVVISGDLCFQYAYDKAYVGAFLNSDINLVLFNRTELAPDVALYNLKDIQNDESGEHAIGQAVWDEIKGGNCGGQLKKAYPDYSFGTVGAWAWGYSRCIDALEKLGNVDLSLIAFTGHSRGGKTAALAGALDTRAKIVNPNASCMGGYSSYRMYMEAETESGEIKASETLGHIFNVFPSWMGNGLAKYIGHEEMLPFDSHFLKAMVAPRILFVSEAASDIMANPVGSYQTTEAAGEVYDFLGCPENLIWYFRGGTHSQTIEDISQLVNIINHVRNGEALNDKFFKLPFKCPDKAYSWEKP